VPVALADVAVADAAAADAAIRLCTALEIFPSVALSKVTVQESLLLLLLLLLTTTEQELFLAVVLISYAPPSWGHCPIKSPRSGSGLLMLILKKSIQNTPSGSELHGWIGIFHDTNHCNAYTEPSG
jgi:hypothetical protein